MRTVVIVGASLAGLSSAQALRSQGFDGRLVVIGDEVHRPYDRPPLSKDFLAGKLQRADLALEEADEDLDVQWVLGAAATALDRSERSVVLADGARIRTDGVVIATGAGARTLPGTSGLAGVHTLRTVDDAVALREEMQPGRRLLVIGAGFIGAETASTAHQLGLDVTVIESLPTPMAGPLGIRMGAVVSELHTDNGVRLECGTGVRGLVGGSRVEAVELADERVLAADVVVVGIGAKPNVQWLEGSGLEIGNGVLCDSGGATTVPGVVAVGDCAAWQDPRTGRHVRVEHWTGALQRPKAAVDSLLSGSPTGHVPAPVYFWSDQYDVRIQVAGEVQHSDAITIEEGDTESRSFVAVYRRFGTPVAVLGMNRSRAFGRWRRSLHQVPAVT